MGQARETMDRITEAILAGDRDALRREYADDAVGEAPDADRLDGGDAIVEYLISFRQAFPDLSWEARATFENADSALDEGLLVGTHTGTLSSPEGDLPPTGRSLRLRECDVITVRDGRAVSHRFYYDRMDLADQLGLTASGTAVPAPRAGTDQEPETVIP
ncbi:ester cyclase [Geodermatophilus sp. URMC 61]|uniref:ester cyclase n=1 Tax=Geodermatophilus sp. URMC 61 TaxID=3423411 RepID=UPI00406D32A5